MYVHMYLHMQECMYVCKLRHKTCVQMCKLQRCDALPGGVAQWTSHPLQETEDPGSNPSRVSCGTRTRDLKFIDEYNGCFVIVANGPSPSCRIEFYNIGFCAWVLQYRILCSRIYLLIQLEATVAVVKRNEQHWWSCCHANPIMSFCLTKYTHYKIWRRIKKREKEIKKKEIVEKESDLWRRITVLFCAANQLRIVNFESSCTVRFTVWSNQPFFSLSSSKPGLPDFSWYVHYTKTGKKCTKWTQNVSNEHKMYQMNTNVPKVIKCNKCR
jgi:hypothetical protein